MIRLEIEKEPVRDHLGRYTPADRVRILSDLLMEALREKGDLPTVGTVILDGQVEGRVRMIRHNGDDDKVPLYNYQIRAKCQQWPKTISFEETWGPQ